MRLFYYSLNSAISLFDNFVGSLEHHDATNSLYFCEIFILLYASLFRHDYFTFRISSGVAG